MTNEERILFNLDGLGTLVRNLNLRLELMDIKLKKIDDRLASVEDRLTLVEGRLTLVEGRLDKIETDVADVKDRLILIENDHGQHLKALHDGYVMNYGISNEIRDELQKIAIHQERQDTRLMRLESIAASV